MASKLFSELEYSVKLQRASQAQSLLQQIDNDFANTPYQDQGHLLMSKLFIDATEYDNAIIQLEFLLDNSEEESLQHISRLRIARIKLQQNFLDEALTTLQIESMGTFEAKYEEIKGDIYSEKGDLLQARESYLRALDLMLPGNFDYDFIQIKLKDIQNKETLGSVDTEEDTA
jgi:predicted negative regulator of RcsB-dependent stress response